MQVTNNYQPNYYHTPNFKQFVVKPGMQDGVKEYLTKGLSKNELDIFKKVAEEFKELPNVVLTFVEKAGSVLPVVKYCALQVEAKGIQLTKVDGRFTDWVSKWAGKPYSYESYANETKWMNQGDSYHSTYMAETGAKAQEFADAFEKASGFEKALVFARAIEESERCRKAEADAKHAEKKAIEDTADEILSLASEG